MPVHRLALSTITHFPAFASGHASDTTARLYAVTAAMVNGTAGAAAAVAVGAISRLNMVSPTHNLPPSVWRVHSVDDPLLKMDLALFALFFTLL